MRGWAIFQALDETCATVNFSGWDFVFTATKKSIQHSDGRWSGLPPAGRQRRAAGGGRVYKGYRSQASLSPWVSLARKGSERSGTVSWNCPSLDSGTEPGLYLIFFFFLQFSPDWMLQVRIEDDV